MGSEQSQHQNPTTGVDATRLVSSSGNRLQRGYTIAAPSSSGDHYQDPSITLSGDSRPVSPPISVCSDSDLPYISYTDRPIGDSPKLINKGQTPSLGRGTRANSTGSTKRTINVRNKIKSTNTAHNIVVVKAASKEVGVECDEDIMRLKSIPMFLPVMRGTHLRNIRDPEIYEKLEPIHLRNMCSRLQTHFNVSANRVANDQAQLTLKVQEIDQEITRLLNLMIEKQKLYSTYAEHFTKMRQISQQLSRCNTQLNQNIESMDQLNNFLAIEDRLEPFVWKTG